MNNTFIHNYTTKFKQKALDLGFLSVGISKADFLEDEAPHLENWLKNNYNGKMGYMENHFDKRLDPRLLVEGAKSVVSLLYNYSPKQEQPSNSKIKISRYAYGEDYHYVIKDKLFELLTWLNEEIGEVNGRAFTDSAPVLERAWAAKSGIGWVGKNANLLTKRKGSYHFISELIIDLEFEYDNAIATNHCGSCTACIDACPTDAILAPALIDGSRCISYLTIELKDEFPANTPEWGNWVFGCDVCQEVCPWNRFAIPTNEPRFNPTPEILTNELTDWIELTEETFKKVFKKSPIMRTKYNGLKRNINRIYNKIKTENE